MKNRFIKLQSLFIAGAMALLTACGSTTTGASAISVSEDSVTAESSENASSSADSSTTESAVDENSYEAKLFDTSYVHTIDIEISDEDWADLLENPTDKTKYEVNVTIDGEKVEDVSFATKGNTSLSSITEDDTTERYSFKINFGKYVDGQTYYGLDKLNLNNIYADATYIKDYLSYQLFNYMGVDAPLTSFINVTINGEAWGLYLAIEDVSDSFLERTDNSDGELYKPETSMLAGMGDFGGGKGGDFDPQNMPEGFDPENMPEDFTPGEMPDGFDPENLPDDFQPGSSNDDGEATEGSSSDGNNSNPDKGNKGPGDGFGGFGGFGGNDSGASLKYTDDELTSYSDIFDNAETDATEEDEARVVASLKNLSEGNITESVNIDSVIDYFVVHNFVMNYDSYTGNMLHNYYLYEEDGILQMIPWDYNLAYGRFMNMGGGHGKDARNNEQTDNNDSMSDSSDATETVNYGIDSPLSGAEEEDRPMWSWIVNNSEYLQQYHEEFEKLVSYVLSDEFSAEMDRLYEMLYPYVESDATAFYTIDEFKTGFETIKEFVTLRAESIKKQINGELSTVTEEQDESDRVDASGINIKDMGSQGGGHDSEGHQGGGPKDGPDKLPSEKNTDEATSETPNDNT